MAKMANLVPKKKPKSKDGMNSPYESTPSLHLDHKHLKALGITDANVGDQLEIHAKGHVTSRSQHQDTAEDGTTGEPRGHIQLDLKKMAVKATQRAAKEGTIQEGDLDGAKAAMDQALDKQEMSKPQLAKHRKTVGSKP